MTDVKLSTDAATKLRELSAGGKKLILDLDDGVGPFSSVGICALNIHFNVIAAPADKVSADFNQTLDSEVGPIYIKDYSTDYFGKQPKLSLGSGSIFSFSDESGLLDGTVGTVKVNEETPLAKGQKGGAASC
ncbi:iron-sulfur cluster biosynthesis family protein [Lacticaseibacillus pabuli]|uniref:Iron-sulfur cluster biosynthesis family protein n=1 Tax=Lacticaseibacillus pabuli TaxID=3025672 RepID=A0ABY7WSF4_9LACO|nr:iron-sulfur cluster biosynthesis family protein [Lacticaseibacillus sp. KACC 23028]WDF82343.1 iron-sulfur cluster biosynthesis family protein [Lacticaseibacillus sp. KACC 23028]